MEHCLLYSKMILMFCKLPHSDYFAFMSILDVSTPLRRKLRVPVVEQKEIRAPAFFLFWPPPAICFHINRAD